MLIGPLLSDAELPKNITKDFVCSDLAGDGAKMIKRFTQVLRHEVGGGAGSNAATGEGKGAGSRAKGVEMAGI